MLRMSALTSVATRTRAGGIHAAACLRADTQLGDRNESLDAAAASAVARTHGDMEVSRQVIFRSIVPSAYAECPPTAVLTPINHFQAVFLAGGVQKSARKTAGCCKRRQTGNTFWCTTGPKQSCNAQSGRQTTVTLRGRLRGRGKISHRVHVPHRAMVGRARGRESGARPMLASRPTGMPTILMQQRRQHEPQLHARAPCL